MIDCRHVEVGTLGYDDAQKALTLDEGVTEQGIVYTLRHVRGRGPTRSS